jgi:peptidoglycan DL-endopeptidase CwlO
VKPGTAIAGLTAAAALPLIGLPVLFGGAPHLTVAAAMDVCATSGPVTGLDAEQAGNARVIVAVTRQVAASAPSAVGPASVIALMAAYQESSLRDLANPNVLGSAAQPGAIGSGTNLDSVGLFQQRASWGTVAQRMDPAWSTTAFLDHLLAVPGWRSMPPGAAAQAVQRSAFPDVYAQWQPDAQSWLAQIDDGPGRACGGSGLAERGTTLLPPDLILPSRTSPAATIAVTFALAQLGKPYVFGAAGPDAYDCSGLTMAAWAAAGVQLPHYTVAQADLGTPVAAPSLLQPGDLVFIPGSDGTMQAPGHVGMYIGNDQIIEAPDTGDVVKLVSLASFGPVASMRRPE